MSSLGVSNPVIFSGRQKPMVGRLKYNVDVVVHRNLRCISFGADIRDSNAMFIFGLSGTYNSYFLLALAEVFFLRDVLSWLRSSLFCNIDIEMDAKLVVDACLSKYDDWSEFNLTVIDYHFIFRSDV